MSDDAAVRAARYALDETIAHLELGTLESTNQIHAFRKLLDLLRAICDGEQDKVSGLLEELALQLVAADKAAADQVAQARHTTAAIAKRLQSTQSAPPSVAPEVIATELKRRTLAGEQIDLSQEDFENRLLTLQEDHSIAEAELQAEGTKHRPKRDELARQIGEVQHAITICIAHRRENSQAIAELKRFSQALELIARGLPAGLIENGALPPSAGDKKQSRGQS